MLTKGIARLLFLIFTFMPLASWGQSDSVKPDLFFFLIDRSKSISDNHLTDPFYQAVSAFVNELPLNSEFRLAFFSDEMTGVKAWRGMDVEHRKEIRDFFKNNFKPGGSTKLYDSVVEVAQNIQKNEDEFDDIFLMVLSDGEDNRSAKYRSWADVESAGPVTWALEREGFTFTWQYISEKAPKDRPSKNSKIIYKSTVDPADIFKMLIPDPNPEFKARPINPAVGEEVLFVLNQELGAESVLWEFGDGQQSKLKKPMHIYNTPGEYTVKVTVKGHQSQEASEEKAGYIEVVQTIPLEADYSWRPQKLVAGEKVYFVNESRGSVERLNWNIPGNETSSLENPDVVFPDAGTVEVSLTVYSKGESDVRTRSLTIFPQPPNAEFTIEPREVKFGEKVSLIANSQDEKANHVWRISTGDVLRGSKVEWTSNQSGLIDIEHVVESNGLESKDIGVVMVAEKPDKLVPAFTWAPAEPHAGEAIRLIDESTGGPVNWVWDVNEETLKGRAANYTFHEAGSFAVRLTVMRDGEQAELLKTVVVLPEVISLQADFRVSDRKGGQPLEVTFQDRSKGAIATWEWDFGDGETSNIKEPTHIYENPGEYRPRLVIRTDEGKEAMDSGATVITVTPPLPLWKKVIYGLGLLLVGWLLFVNSLLKKLMLPLKRAALKGETKTYFIRRIAQKKSSIFWPRSYVLISTEKGGDIRLSPNGGVKGDIAVIKRIFGSKDHEMIIRMKSAIYLGAKTIDPVSGNPSLLWTERTGKVKLTDGIQLKIFESTFEWNQSKK